MKVRNEQGTALIVTLLVVVIMTVTVTEFLYAAWIDRDLAAEFRDSTRGVFALRSAIEAARRVIVEDYRNDQASAAPTDTLKEYWAQSAFPIPIDDTYMFLTITDESSKIDLNRLVDAWGNPDFGADGRSGWITVFKRLLRNQQLDENIALYVFDWIDRKRKNGTACDGWYQSLEFPYKCKNKPLDSVEELMRVRGITPEVFAKIRKFVTIRSAGWININTAPQEVLMALDDDLTPSMVADIINRRSNVPFSDKQEIQSISGIPVIFPRISNYIGVSTDTFSATATVTFGESRHRADAILTNRNSLSAIIIYFRVN